MTSSPNNLPRIALVGGGVHATVVAGCIRHAGLATVAGYVDVPDHDRDPMRKMQVAYLGSDHTLAERTAGGEVTHVVLAIAGLHHTALRFALVQRLDDIAPRWWTAIHRLAIVDETATIAEGTVVFAGAIINPLARIGRHVVINTGAIIEHLAVIEDFAVISPGATLCGGVRIGRGSFVGAGATIITDVKVGPDAIIAAGAVVLKDVPPGATVMGNPGRIRESVSPSRHAPVGAP